MSGDAKMIGIGAGFPQQISLRVLVVEDTLLHQRLEARLLERQGHVVTITSNGKEAVELLETQHFDLVLMDVEMPVMDGLTATAVIRRRERSKGGRTAIVAVTSSARPEECLEAGMDAHIPKPLRLDALKATVAELGVC
jgi:CheY-like chemotaxis protein